MRTKLLGAVVAAASAALAGLPAAGHPAPVAVGLQYPEGVYWDADANTWYVSNLGGPVLNPTGREEDGFISRIGPDEDPIAETWVTGLRSPKGMRRHGRYLYVADVDQLVVIDVGRGAIAEKISLQTLGARFLNDVAVDPRNGDLYATETAANAIIRLDGTTREASVFLKTPELEAPNGLLYDDGRLIVAGVGPDFNAATFQTSAPGRVLAVDLDARSVSPLGGSMPPLGTLDGIEKLGRDYVVSDFASGRLYRVSPEGVATQIAQLAPTAADIGLNRDEGFLGTPQMALQSVVFSEVR